MVKKIAIRFSLIVGLTLCAVVIGYLTIVGIKLYKGTARLLTERVPLIVYADGQQQHASSFEMKKDFNGQESDSLIVLIGRWPVFYDSIFIVDRGKGLVGPPPYGDNFVLPGGVLYQTETGSGLVPFNDEKWYQPFDPKLTMSDNTITFKLAGAYKWRTIELRLSPK